MSTTTENIHQAEQAHDARLYELLTAAALAGMAVEQAEFAITRSAVAAYVSHTYEARVPDPTDLGGSRRVKADDLPAGTIVEQGKTFSRGEAGFYVTGEPGAYTRNRRTLRFSDIDLTTIDEAKVETLSAAGVELAECRQAIVDHEQGYTGWNRYFLVTSSAGHVHRSMNCSTCNPATTFAPVVELSGQSDGEAVELVGETLCTVCFPEAPVNGKPSKLTKAQASKLVAR